MSRADAIAYCRQTAGAIVVVEDPTPSPEWDVTNHAFVVNDDEPTRAVKTEWAETRSALQRRIPTRRNVWILPEKASASRSRQSRIAISSTLATAAVPPIMTA
jgi:hypothetical protein